MKIKSNNFLAFALGMFVMSLALAVSVKGQDYLTSPPTFFVSTAALCTANVAPTGGYANQIGECIQGDLSQWYLPAGTTTWKCYVGPATGTNSACPALASSGVSSISFNGGAAQTGAVVINPVLKILNCTPGSTGTIALTANGTDPTQSVTWSLLSPATGVAGSTGGGTVPVTLTCAGS